MPELPDVEIFKRRLARQGLRKTIDRVVVSDSRILGKLTAQGLRRRLSGRKFLSVRRHGKHLLARLEGEGWLTMHFGMSGGLQFFKAADAEPPFTRVRLDFSRDGHLAYTNKRMIGRIGLANDAKDFIAQERLGPDALGRNFTFAALKRAAAGNQRTVKSVLMDQEIVAGIGNIYSDEILFHARIDPRRPIGALDAAQLRRLYRSIRISLKTAISHGAGSEQFTERMPRGSFLPARKKGGTCPRCARPLKISTLGGRTAYFCVYCQH